MMINRRGLLLGAGSLFAAPAIVHVENIMPVRLMLPKFTEWGFACRPVATIGAVNTAIEWAHERARLRLEPGERYEIRADHLDFWHAVGVAAYSNSHMIMRRQWGESKRLDLPERSFVIGEFMTPED